MAVAALQLTETEAEELRRLLKEAQADLQLRTDEVHGGLGFTVGCQSQPWGGVRCPKAAHSSLMTRPDGVGGHVGGPSRSAKP